MPGKIRALLLGPPVVLSDDTPVDVQRREVRGLLFYLACHREPVSREALIDLLFDDEDGQGSKRLRVALARLKNVLPERNLLVVNRQWVCLDPKSVSSDYLDYQDLLQEINPALSHVPVSSPLPEPLHQKVLQAVEAWRSPRFLDGAHLANTLSMDDWRENTADLLQVSRRRLLERLSDHESAVGRLESAQGWINRALELDPLDESLHLRLLALLERQGRLTDALAHCKKVDDLYRREEIQELPRSIQAVWLRLRENPAALPAGGASYRPERRSLSIPFLGRRRELERLRQAGMRGTAVLVLGEAGAGKTRLVQQHLETMQPAPRRLVVAARLLESALPLQLWIDLLRRHMVAEDWKKVSPVWVAPLTLLLPELLLAQPQAQSLSPTGAMAQPLLFEAIHQAMLALAQSGRVVLFFDDMQWADETSLNALAFLMERRFIEKTAGLILAGRVEEPGEALSHFLMHLPDPTQVERVLVEPLSREDTAEAARFALNGSPSPTLVDKIHRDTGGNPLFLVETLRMMLDYSLNWQSMTSVDSLPVSSGIHAIVHARLQRLSKDAQTMIQHAAAIGSDFSVRLLGKVLSFQPDHLVNVLEELERARMVAPGTLLQNGDGYSFLHDKIREVALLDLNPVRRRLIHDRIARALLEETGDQPGPRSGLIAYHLQEAGELQEAAVQWLNAARYARRLFSSAEAQNAFRKAEALFGQSDQPISDMLQLTLYREWAEMAHDAADAETLEKVAQTLIRQGFQRNNPEMISSGYFGLTLVHDLRGEAEEGLRRLDQLQTYLGEIRDPGIEQLIKNRRAGFYIAQNRYLEASELLESALVETEGQRFPQVLEMRLSQRYHLGRLYCVRGLPLQALEQAEKGMAESRLLGSHSWATRAVLIQMTANYFTGRWHLVVEQAETAERMARLMGNPRLTSNAAYFVALSRLVTGRMDEAWDMISMLNRPHAFNMARFMLADLYATLGDFTSAEHWARAGLEGVPPGYVRLEGQVRLARLLTLTGRGEAGADLICETVEFARRTGMDLYALLAEAVRAEHYLTQGDAAQARVRAEALSSDAVRRGMMELRLKLLELIVRIALRTGQADEARQKSLLGIRWAAEQGDLVGELTFLRHAVAALPQTGDSADSMQNRIDAIHNFLLAHGTRPEIRPLVQKFVAN